MDALSIISRGYVCPLTEVPTILALAPNPLETFVAQTPSFTVVLSAPALGDTVVTLASTDASVFSVPATVTVLDGELTATFTGTAVAIGTAFVEAELDTVVVLSSVTVLQRLTVSQIEAMEVNVVSKLELQVEVVSITELEVEFESRYGA